MIKNANKEVLLPYHQAARQLLGNFVSATRIAGALVIARNFANYANTPLTASSFREGTPLAGLAERAGLELSGLKEQAALDALLAKTSGQLSDGTKVGPAAEPKNRGILFLNYLRQQASKGARAVA